MLHPLISIIHIKDFNYQIIDHRNCIIENKKIKKNLKKINMIDQVDYSFDKVIYQF